MHTCVTRPLSLNYTWRAPHVRFHVFVVRKQHDILWYEVNEIIWQLQISEFYKNIKRKLWFRTACVDIPSANLVHCKRYLKPFETYFWSSSKIMKHPKINYVRPWQRILIAKRDQFTDSRLTDRQCIHLCIVTKANTNDSGYPADGNPQVLSSNI